MATETRDAGCCGCGGGHDCAGCAGIPDTLYLTVTGTGTCTTNAGTYRLDWDDSASQWIGSGLSDAGVMQKWGVSCSGVTVFAPTGSTCSGSGTLYSATIDSCSPFHMSRTLSPISTDAIACLCPGASGASVTFDVTE